MTFDKIGRKQALIQYFFKAYLVKKFYVHVHSTDRKFQCMASLFSFPHSHQVLPFKINKVFTNTYCPTFRWYRANYNMAEPLAWGQNTGCIIPHGSCGEWIETQQQKLVYYIVHVLWYTYSSSVSSMISCL